MVCTDIERRKMDVDAELIDVTEKAFNFWLHEAYPLWYGKSREEVLNAVNDDDKRDKIMRYTDQDVFRVWYLGAGIYKDKCHGKLTLKTSSYSFIRDLLESSARKFVEEAIKKQLVKVEVPLGSNKRHLILTEKFESIIKNQLDRWHNLYMPVSDKFKPISKYFPMPSDPK